MSDLPWWYVSKWPICPNCNIYPRNYKGMRNGKPRITKWCDTCSGKKWKFATSHKKKFCELCGFEAEHPIQLDVDHIDGDRNNNNPDNFCTVCANCHRLKTLINKDNNRYKYQDNHEMQ